MTDPPPYSFFAGGELRLASTHDLHQIYTSQNRHKWQKDELGPELGIDAGTDQVTHHNDNDLTLDDPRPIFGDALSSLEASGE